MSDAYTILKVDIPSGGGTYLLSGCVSVCASDLTHHPRVWLEVDGRQLPWWANDGPRGVTHDVVIRRMLQRAAGSEKTQVFLRCEHAGVIPESGRLTARRTD